MGDLTLKGATSGQITLTPTAVAGTNTLTLPAKTGNIITSADSGTVTQTMLASNVGASGPAFGYITTGAQTLTINTFTKITFNTKQFDTNNLVSSSRFTPNIAGYYVISGGVGVTNGTNTTLLPSIFKNGAEYRRGAQILVLSGTVYGSTVTGIVYLNGSTDYVEIYAYANTAATVDASGTGNVFFDGALVRAA